MKTVKRALITSFTFYFAILSLLIILNNCYGCDSHCLVLIGLNPILKALCYTDFGLNVMGQGPMIAVNFVGGEISIYWYLAHYISFVLFGAVLDGFKALIQYLLLKRDKAEDAVEDEAEVKIEAKAEIKAGEKEPDQPALA